VVGGLEILDKLEEIQTDYDEKPLQEIKINRIVVFVDPFEVILLNLLHNNIRNGKRSGKIKK